MKQEAKMFYVHEAEKYGVDKAILINYLRIFIAANRSAGRSMHEGRAYTYNTHQEIAERHPFWTKQKVGRMVRELVDEGVLVVAHLSENRWDRTSYYAFADEANFLPPHVINSETSDDIKTETSDDINPEPSYTEESLKSPKDYVTLVEEYFTGRGATPVDAEHMAHEFIEYWRGKDKAPTPDNFRRHAATWFRNATKFGQIATGGTKLTKQEFAEMQARYRLENKTFDPTGWSLKGDYWIKEG
jgi:hypothetical protein